MKLKNWVSAVLLVIATLLILSTLIIDKTAFDVVALALALVCNVVLTKYSKICD